MNLISFSADYGLSAVCPQLTECFLAMQPLPAQHQLGSYEVRQYHAALSAVELLTLNEYKSNLAALRELDSVFSSAQAPGLYRWVLPALKHWCKLDLAQACRLFTEHLSEYPADTAVLFMLHQCQFFAGRTHELPKSITPACNQPPTTSPFLSHHLAIQAFAWVEARRYIDARELAENALAIDPRNVYAIHAMAHALHEQGAFSQVRDFLQDCKAIWQDHAAMGMHVGWHLAMAYYECQQEQQAYVAFQDFYAMKPGFFAKQDLDAVGFLWRARLQHPKLHTCLAPLWDDLAVSWLGSIGASTSYLHRIHAALAFTATEQPKLIEKLLSECDEMGFDTLTHRTGILVLKGLLEFALDNPVACQRALRSSRPYWDLLGGSHAQRELLDITLNACDTHLAATA